MKILGFGTPTCLKKLLKPLRTSTKKNYLSSSFVNWRGFIGGQQDYIGSMIVDGLLSYKQPVFVYIILIKMMDHLDPQHAKLKAATSESTLKTELAAHKKQLSGTYTATALQFADLHNPTKRTKAKGTIREALDGSESRR
ncbi:hypothetical protein PSHT_02828 [Puccinia striiformis]|uniref:Uncharacterized protein n=2 Tax=Puccinia striiformis TaxID=27350 RepID=A0A2S4WGX7_9BASI|nr:hypothetical protein PSHT_02828 [Puccinia striiformis]